MANSSFQIQKVDIPVPVNKGGTGVTSLTDKGVLIGNGTGNVTTIDPGTSGNYLVSNGTDWITSASPSIGDATVSYSKLATDLISISAISASDVDWTQGAVFTKTLSGNTTLTFSNVQLDRIIVLEISGNYTLTLPSSVSILGGIYNGTVVNYITLHCTNTSSQEIWATINQRMVSDSSYGYFAGGATTESTYSLDISDKIAFSTGVTSASTVSNLSSQRQRLAGLSDCSYYGYFAGGTTGGSNTTDRLVFSTKVTGANTASNLSQSKQGLAGLSDLSTYGYFTGGVTGVTAVNTSDRIVFSTSVTSANTVSNISQARSQLAGVSDASSYGYFTGGYTTGIVLTGDRIVFSTGVTSANTVSNLSQARRSLAGISDGSSYGYFAGGCTVSEGNSGGNVATGDRIVFSTGVTSANTVSNLSQARRGLSGVSDASIYGYFAGGYTGSPSYYVAIADRIVFSTGVTSANTVSNLYTARYLLAGLSDCSV